jgi:hypothetical protein
MKIMIYQVSIKSIDIYLEIENVLKSTIKREKKNILVKLIEPICLKIDEDEGKHYFFLFCLPLFISSFDSLLK